MKKIIAAALALLLLTGAALADYETDAADAWSGADGEWTDADNAQVDADVFAQGEIAVTAAGIDVPAPEAILIEKETGEVLYEKNADQQRQPASVTKVMTMLLIAEAIDSGRTSPEELVSVSAAAEEMGGSQVYLAQGEQMSVQELLKCIVVSSANDAAVAMAEHLAGTEAAFVQKMNERAAELGLENTHFTNCTGLMNDPEHVTTARDIAVMSRELLKHVWIKEYTTIWMDTIRDGTFGLSNTNKLIRHYDGATGLKTGFTREAMYCLSASAERGGVEYIAVVMGCATTQERFKSASDLLNYAFANYTLVTAAPEEPLGSVRVRLGSARAVQPVLPENTEILVRKSQASGVVREVELPEEISAPVAAGDVIGTLTVSDENGVLAQLDITAGADVQRLTWGQLFRTVLRGIFGCEHSVKTVD